MGEVVKKGSRYYIRFYDSDGKRRMRAAKGAASHAEARRMLVQVEAQIASGARTAEQAESVTVSELCDRFIASSHPRAKSAEQYRRQAAAGLKPVLPLIGNIQLAKLRRKDIEAARDKLSARFKPNTVRAALRPLGSALSWAVGQEFIAQSPMTRLALPRKESSAERLSAEQAAVLLSEARAASSRSLLAGSLYIAVSLALRLGLRRSEVYGLLWQDVDLNTARLTVRRQRSGKLPKNGRPRTLPIPAALLGDLTAWRARNLDRVVCPCGGFGIKHLARLLRKVGAWPASRPYHMLRHSFASLFIEAGGSVVVLKEALGHSDLSTSMVYVNLTPAALAADIDKLKI